MSRPDLQDYDSFSGQTAISPQWHVTIAIILLTIAYYAWPRLAYETTIKRRLYEFGTAIIPSQFARALQKSAALLPSLARHAPVVRNVESQTNSGAVGQVYEGSVISSVVHRARTLSGLATLAPKKIEATYSGLGNWDNSCFQNSVLQGLASLSAFENYVDRNWYMCTAAGGQAPTHEALRTFLRQLQQAVSSRETLWPPSILRSMNTWQQQDAQEYFSKIMDAIEKEAKSYQRLMSTRFAPSLGCLQARKSGYGESSSVLVESCAERAQKLLSVLLPRSPLDGFLSQALRCQTCGFSEGISLMPFNCLTLNLGLGGDSYLEELLDAYTDPELIEGVECDECTRLTYAQDSSETQQPAADEPAPEALRSEDKHQVEKKQKVLSTKAKQILFGRLPQNLVVHLNRSIFDEYGSQRKNTAHVYFPLTLPVGHEWMETPLAEQGSETQAVYELRCIVTHQGRHDNGHYVACGKRGKEWYLFNDEIVTRISEEQVLARGHVFMLFYEQVDRRSILEIPTPESTSSSEDAEHSPTETSEQINETRPEIHMEAAEVQSTTQAEPA